NVHNLFTMRDSDTEYLLFITKKRGEYGFSYDLLNDKVVKGFRFTGDKNQVMISSSNKMIFYAVGEGDNSKGLEMAEYKFTGRTLLSSDNITQMEQFKRMCLDDKGASIHLAKKPTEKCETVKLPMSR